MAKEIGQEFTEEMYTRLEKLFACSVAERFALLYVWGIDHLAIRMLNLGSSPQIDAFKVIHFFTEGGWAVPELASLLLNGILMTPLRPGIPE